MTIKILALLVLVGYLAWMLYSRIQADSKKTPGIRKMRIMSPEGDVFDVRLKEVTSAKKAPLNDDSFIKIAKAIFGQVSEAFAQNKLSELKELLTPKVYSVFAKEIEKRKEKKQALDFSLIGINSAKILKKSDNYKSVTVQFTSEQVNVLKDEATNVIEGDPMYVARMTDIWTFKKDRLNWVVAATKSEVNHA